MAIFVIGFAIYKLTFWMEDYQIERLYTRGERTPVVSEITLDDGRSAHSISFFANDGDQIYIPELQRSAIVAGHVAARKLPTAIGLKAWISKTWKAPK